MKIPFSAFITAIALAITFMGAPTSTPATAMEKHNKHTHEHHEHRHNEHHDATSMHEHSTLEIMMPSLAPTLNGAPVGGGYLAIQNNGDEADTLLGGSVDFAARVEVHEMVMDGDVMNMRALPQGLDIPSGEHVVLKPGGYHLMLMGLTSQLKEGDVHDITLTFEKAGEIVVEFRVKERSAIQKELGGEHMDHVDHSHADHSGHKHNH